MSSSYRSKFRSIEIVSGPAMWPTIGWVVLAVFAQTVLAPYLQYRGTVPSLVTIAIVLYALRVGARRAAIVGIIAGAIEDALGGTGGAWTIATTLIAIGAGTVARGFFSDGFPILGALIALTVLVRDAIFWFVMSLQGYPPGLGTPHFRTAVVQAVITGVIAILYLVARSRFITDRTDVERYP